MLRVYHSNETHLTCTELDVAHATKADAEGGLWFDLINPGQHEDHFVEQILGISIPTKEEAGDIEMSSRLYHEDGAEFMTMTGVTQLESDAPGTTPITFILKGEHLVTVRYAQPSPFYTYATRAQKPGTLPCTQGEQIMLGIVEALIQRMAEALEKIGAGFELLSRLVFRHKSAKGKMTKTHDFQDIIQQIGAKGDLLAMVRESLLSLNRLLSYHTARDRAANGLNKDAVAWVRDMQQDVVSLSDHANFLSNKASFLLDATLGLINLEQSQIIKIFSIAAVCLMPPTLVASIYGMNFEYMPELKWLLGYPWAVSAMIITAIIPFYYFKKRGWL